MDRGAWQIRGLEIRGQKESDVIEHAYTHRAKET